MSKAMWKASALLVLAFLAVSARAARHDPLNASEVDQLREVAQEPEKRIALYVKFIKTRAAALEQLQSDPRLTDDRTQQIHSLLEDIDALLQELDDNIDVYVQQHSDLRKPLKAVIDMDTDLQDKLLAIKQTKNPVSSHAEAYAFVLNSAIDSADDSLQNARQTLQDQEEAFKGNKNKKP